jgi:hypothetical protein
MTVTLRYIIASLISGCVWSGIAYYIGHRFMWPFIWFAIVASPFIGIAIGLLYEYYGCCDKRFWVQAGASLVTLYVAIALFGLAAGIGDALRPIPNRISGAVVIQSVIACVHWITISGLFLVLWPLAFANHWLVCRVGRVKP